MTAPATTRSAEAELAHLEVMLGHRRRERDRDPRPTPAAADPAGSIPGGSGSIRRLRGSIPPRAFYAAICGIEQETYRCVRCGAAPPAAFRSDCPCCERPYPLVCGELLPTGERCSRPVEVYADPDVMAPSPRYYREALCTACRERKLTVRRTSTWREIGIPDGLHDHLRAYRLAQHRRRLDELLAGWAAGGCRRSLGIWGDVRRGKSVALAHHLTGAVLSGRVSCARWIKGEQQLLRLLLAEVRGDEDARQAVWALSRVEVLVMDEFLSDGEARMMGGGGAARKSTALQAGDLLQERLDNQLATVLISNKPISAALFAKAFGDTLAARLWSRWEMAADAFVLSGPRMDQQPATAPR